MGSRLPDSDAGRPTTDSDLRASDAERNEVADKLSRALRRRAGSTRPSSRHGSTGPSGPPPGGDLDGLFDDLPPLADEAPPPPAPPAAAVSFVLLGRSLCAVAAGSTAPRTCTSRGCCWSWSGSSSGAGPAGTVTPIRPMPDAVASAGSIDAVRPRPVLHGRTPIRRTTRRTARRPEVAVQRRARQRTELDDADRPDRGRAAGRLGPAGRPGHRPGQDLRQGRRRRPRPRRRQRRVRARAVHRRDGPVGLGQVHPHALHGRPRHADLGPDLRRATRRSACSTTPA